MLGNRLGGPSPLELQWIPGPLWEKRKLPGKSDRAIFGTQTFGSQTPTHSSSLLKQACSSPQVSNAGLSNSMVASSVLQRRRRSTAATDIGTLGAFADVESKFAPLPPLSVKKCTVVAMDVHGLFREGAREAVEQDYETVLREVHGLVNKCVDAPARDPALCGCVGGLQGLMRYFSARVQQNRGVWARVIRAGLCLRNFFLLWTAPMDHQPPTATNRQPPTATNHKSDKGPGAILLQFGEKEGGWDSKESWPLEPPARGGGWKGRSKPPPPLSPEANVSGAEARSPERPDADTRWCSRLDTGHSPTQGRENYAHA